MDLFLKGHGDSRDPLSPPKSHEVLGPGHGIYGAGRLQVKLTLCRAHVPVPLSLHPSLTCVFLLRHQHIPTLRSTTSAGPESVPFGEFRHALTGDLMLLYYNKSFFWLLVERQGPLSKPRFKPPNPPFARIGVWALVSTCAQPLATSLFFPGIPSFFWLETLEQTAGCLEQVDGRENRQAQAASSTAATPWWGGSSSRAWGGWYSTGSTAAGRRGSEGSWKGCELQTVSSPQVRLVLFG